MFRTTIVLLILLSIAFIIFVILVIYKINGVNNKNGVDTDDQWVEPYPKKSTKATNEKAVKEKGDNVDR